MTIDTLIHMRSRKFNISDPMPNASATDTPATAHSPVR